MPSLKKSIAFTAIVSGTIGLVALLFLILLYAVELPTVKARGRGEAPGNHFYITGFLNDLLTMISLGGVFLFVWLFSRELKHRGHAIPVFFTSMGMVGAAGIVMAMFSFIVGWITLMEQAVYYLYCFGPLGIWHLSVGIRCLKTKAISATNAWFAVVIGIGELIAVLAFFLFGGLQVFTITDFASYSPNYIMVGALALGGGVLGYIGGNIWLLLLGREMLSGE